MKSSSTAAILSDSQQIDDVHPSIAIGHCRTERERVRQEHKLKLGLAVGFAQSSVWSDRQMGRLPHVRWRVVECAAHHALSGIDRPPVMDLHGVPSADTEIVMAALLKAVDAVKDGMKGAF